MNKLLEYIKDYEEEINSLPYKWCIKTTLKNVDILKKYTILNKHLYEDYKSYWGVFPGYWFTSENFKSGSSWHQFGLSSNENIALSGFIEITQEQLFNYYEKKLL